MEKNKKKVLLHYFQYGTQRSPSDQFDLLSSQQLLNEQYDFKILNQEFLVKEIGTIKSIRILKRKIEEEKPDIVHISGVKEGFHCMIAATLAGCKKRVLITHGFAGLYNGIPFFKRMLFRWVIEPITLLLATDVQCNSKFSYNVQMIRLFARNKRHLVYNFLKPIHPSFSQWRKEKNISENSVIITTIGNMHFGKGYDIVDKVIEYFSEDIKVKFVIIGDGQLKSCFDDKNKAYIKSGKLYTLGKIPHEQAMQILSESDIFFLPTRFETLGMVFAEAGYLGIPCVGTSVGAVEEVVPNNKTGIIIPNNNIDASICAIKKLIDDKPYRVNLGNNAKKHIFDMFSSENTSKSIIELYERRLS